MPDLDQLSAVLHLIQQGGLKPPPTNENETVARALTKGLLPHVTDPEFWKNRPAPNMEPNAVGKVPEADADPRIAGTLSDAGNALNQAVPMMGPGGMLGSAIRGLRGAAAPAAESASAAFSRPLQTGAALLSGAPDAASADEARVPLPTPNPLRALDIEKQRKEQELADEVARKRAMGQVDLEQEGVRKKQEAELAAIMASKQRSTEANLPFREKYPDFTKALPGMAAGLAFGVPYGTRAIDALRSNSATKMWEKALAGAGSNPTAQQIAQLKAFQKGGNQAVPLFGKAAAIGGASAPFDAFAIPRISDIQNLNEGDPNRERAKNELMDPSRIASALIQGVPSALIGSKFPMMVPERQPPTALTEGIINAEKSARAAATRAANTKKKKP